MLFGAVYKEKCLFCIAVIKWSALNKIGYNHCGIPCFILLITLDSRLSSDSLSDWIGQWAVVVTADDCTCS